MTTDWDARAPSIGDLAPDPALLDEAGKPAELRSLFPGPLLVLFVPWPADEATTRLLKEYRDATMVFQQIGVKVLAITPAEPSAIRFLRRERGIGFPLFSDPDATAGAQWGLSGKLGLFLVDRHFIVRQRALGETAPKALLNFIQRGGILTGKKSPPVVDKLVAGLARMRGLFHLPGKTRRAVR